jgi:hypothetical protein
VIGGGGAGRRVSGSVPSSTAEPDRVSWQMVPGSVHRSSHSGAPLDGWHLRRGRRAQSGQRAGGGYVRSARREDDGYSYPRRRRAEPSRSAGPPIPAIVAARRHARGSATRPRQPFTIFILKTYARALSSLKRRIEPAQLRAGVVGSGTEWFVLRRNPADRSARNPG